MTARSDSDDYNDNTGNNDGDDAGQMGTTTIPTPRRQAQKWHPAVKTYDGNTDFRHHVVPTGPSPLRASKLRNGTLCYYKLMMEIPSRSPTPHL